MQTLSTGDRNSKLPRSKVEKGTVLTKKAATAEANVDAANPENVKKKRKRRNKKNKNAGQGTKTENLISRTFQERLQVPSVNTEVIKPNGEVGEVHPDRSTALNNIGSKKEIISESTLSMDKSKQEKSRNQILAERQAKKQGKRKVKESTSQQSAASNKEAVKNEHDASLSVQINNEINKNANHKENQTKGEQVDLNKEKAVSSIDKIKDGIQNLKIDQKPLDFKQNAEKTREQILAEREAKKLAKQAAKNKVKLNNVDSKLDTKSTNDSPSHVKNIEKNEKSVVPSDTPKVTKTEDSKNVISNEVTTKQVENVGLQEQKFLKKKPITKAERRALQEAQRQAKAKLLEEKSKKEKSAPISQKELTTQPNVVPNARKVEKTTALLRENKVKLFNHLALTLNESNLFLNNQQIHPAMVRLGEQYAKRTVVGSNARCIAFLSALKTMIQDYETPPKKEFARGLEGSIKSSMDHLHKCRPLAVSISNAYKYIKMVLTQLPTDKPESYLKEELVKMIDIYVKDQIEKAAQAISSYVGEKISDGDVILTYGCSSLINHILEEARRKPVNFRVIVVDSRPFSEGQELLRRLVLKGIPCTCVLINAIGFIMPEVTKVLLGAHALLANGYVMSRTGTAQIALVARSYNVPVLVCCETHKFSERVQTDAIVYNELGNPDDLILKNVSKDNRLIDWQSYPSLYPLNLNYDVTPPELVTAVVTEVAILPCTSVPVILRIKPTEIGY